jgi:hypothetical protein
MIKQNTIRLQSYVGIYYYNCGKNNLTSDYYLFHCGYIRNYIVMIPIAGNRDNCIPQSEKFKRLKTIFFIFHYNNQKMFK